MDELTSGVFEVKKLDNSVVIELSEKESLAHYQRVQAALLELIEVAVKTSIKNGTAPRTVKNIADAVQVYHNCFRYF
ncbi:MAG: hypothetical protein FWD43_02775 [Coriobacteriia bacterium]|nr:hypothetical protein [Coriobacteriia bacterium]